MSEFLNIFLFIKNLKMNMFGHDDQNFNLYKGSLMQKGYGLGNHFRRFYNWITPLFKKHVLPSIETGAKVVGKQALTTASDVLKDVAQGKKVKEATLDRINTADDVLKNQAEEAIDGKKMQGSGIKTINKRKKKPIFVKSKVFREKDYFD